MTLQMLIIHLLAFVSLQKSHIFTIANMRSKGERVTSVKTFTSTCHNLPRKSLCKQVARG